MPPISPDHHDKKRKNALTGLSVFAVVIVMIALSFASVPLYRIFCSVTGFGGTTQVAETAPDMVLERTITIRFNANIASDLPWQFMPEQRAVSVKIGEKMLAGYRAQNLVNTSSSGSAIFNVTPAKAGKYFKKIECFCFSEQTLKPGERVSMPVLFYIDPAMADDRNMDDVTTITLSYSFFKTGSQALEQGIEDFYNQADDAISNARQDLNGVN